MASSKDSEFFYFRSEFDKTLKTYFEDMLDLSGIPEKLNLDLYVLSCLILLVEREKEIRDFSYSPPARYVRDTFLEDIENIGIGVDSLIIETLDNLVSLGFINESKEDIKPSEQAFNIVNFINNSFPGMPGINLIAYAVQTIDEVHSDRKSLVEGKDVFYQTLKSRSVKGKESSSILNKTVTLEGGAKREKQAVSNKSLRERLSRLRKQSRLRDNNSFIKKTEVKSVFKAFEEPVKEEAETEDKPEEIVEESLESLNVKQEHSSENQETFSEPEQKELNEEIKEAEADENEDISDNEAGAVSDPESEADTVDEAEEKKVEQSSVPGESPENQELQVKDNKAEEVTEESVKDDPVKEPEPVVEKEEPPEPKEDVHSEDLVAKKISEFQNELAMTCPVCNIGKITDSVTEKGKDFYQCSNHLCHFISWAKPFHFPCPVCKNPFLVETVLPGGEKGLKCPRATCDYQQSDQANPESKAKPKKKKKVVRRVRRKK